MNMDECDNRCKIYYNCVGGCGAGKYPGCEKSKRSHQKTETEAKEKKHDERKDFSNPQRLL